MKKRETLSNMCGIKSQISQDLEVYEKRERSVKYVRNKSKISKDLKFYEKKRDWSNMCGINLRLAKIYFMKKGSNMCRINQTQYKKWRPFFS